MSETVKPLKSSLGESPLTCIVELQDMLNEYQRQALEHIRLMSLHDEHPRIWYVPNKIKDSEE